MQSRRFILYMDVLGTEGMADNDSYERLRKLIEFFTSSNREFDFNIEKSEKDGGHDFKNLDPTISNFSDHLVASYPAEYIQLLY